MTAIPVFREPARRKCAGWWNRRPAADDLGEADLTHFLVRDPGPAPRRRGARAAGVAGTAEIAGGRCRRPRIGQRPRAGSCRGTARARSRGRVDLSAHHDGDRILRAAGLCAARSPNRPPGDPADPGIRRSLPGECRTHGQASRVTCLDVTDLQGSRPADRREPRCRTWDGDLQGASGAHHLRLPEPRSCRGRLRSGYRIPHRQDRDGREHRDVSRRPFHRYADGKDLADLSRSSLANLDCIVFDFRPALPVPFPGRRCAPKTFAGSAVLFETGWDRTGGPTRTSRATLSHRRAGRMARSAGSGARGIDSLNIDDTDDGARRSIPRCWDATPHRRASAGSRCGARAGRPVLRRAGQGSGFGTFPVRAFVLAEEVA